MIGIFRTVARRPIRGRFFACDPDISDRRELMCERASGARMRKGWSAGDTLLIKIDMYNVRWCRAMSTYHSCRLNQSCVPLHSSHQRYVEFEVR